MEDLDAPRVVPGASDSILADLEWLGLDWDGPVIVQSSRLDGITLAANRLVDQGLAYPCVCTRGDLQTAGSAPHAGAAEPRYPGTCRGRFSSIEDAERRSGKPAGLRFAVPAGTVEFIDGVAGLCSYDVGEEVGDFLILRKGGAPAYQLAVVADDNADHVTDVVRGDDLLPSTARQKLLQTALGAPHPGWWHLPLVVDDAGRRLAKRTDDLSLFELRARGADPRALVGWVARVSKVLDVDRATAGEITPHFSIDAVSRVPVAVPNQTDSFITHLDAHR
jgi:glutamyl-tRNA synthetase